jgi:hypothetical protein
MFLPIPRPAPVTITNSGENKFTSASCSTGSQSLSQAGWNARVAFLLHPNEGLKLGLV